jgi:uncharacterized protein (TIGR00297 family)
MSYLAYLFPFSWIGANPSRLAIAGVVTLLFTALARLVRGVTPSGSVVGGIICFCMFLAIGPIGIATLGLVFALTWLCTRLGYRRKQQLGTAEQHGGRNAAQVLANLSTAAACACLYASLGQSVFVLAFTAALAEAAADTVSSEFGQANSRSARLITTGQLVNAGTNGAVSFPGSIAGIIAALIVAAVPFLGKLIPFHGFGIASLAALSGMFFDSYLGALFEQKGRLTNNAVNFLSTLSAATVAALIWISIGGH